ncbi:MAG TPA: SusE domain-containing protein [Puia sp.]|nr:SusE domain-containing protein [Puia sp.]
MKNFLKYFFAITILSPAIFLACKKQTNPYYGNGMAPVLQASSMKVTPQASDSNSTILTLNWSNPKYATDSLHQKFIVEIDSAGRNFAHEVTFEVDGPLSLAMTGNQLNTVLANFGFTVGKEYSIDTRVTSSYANNNEQYKSNVVTITAVPYSVPIILTPSSTDPLVLKVSDATSNAISFGWTPSPYGSGTISYALQMDTVGGNFANPQTFQYGTSLKSTLITNDLNTAAINAGVIGGTSKDVEFRIVSYQGTSYTNALVYSNVAKINLTTYVPVPPNLYIVGDATPGGWANPVPVPSQQFTKLDAVSFSITIGLTAGKSYLFLPLNGDWGHKYGGASATGGTLLTDNAVPGSNTPAPATTGVYQIVVNFQTNTYTVTQIPVPANLYIVGDATPGGWANPVPTPTQQFTPIDAVSYGIVVNLTAGKSYLFLPLNGDWGHKYGGASDGTATGGGALLADGAVPGSNTPAPAASGLYLIVVNFATNSYTVTPYTGPSNLYIVGDATAGGWANPVPTPSQQFTQVGNAEFQLTISLTSGKSYLFLPLNGDWGHKFGGATDGTATGGGILLADGAVPGSNTPAPAATGNYLIDVNFITNTYTVTAH